MDDNQTTSPQTTSAPVMDIQPPRPITVTSAPEVPVAVETPASEASIASPLAEAPVESAVDTPAPATAEPEAPTHLIATPGKQSGHKTPILAISAALVVAVGLAVVAVIAFSSQDKKADTPVATTSTTTQTPKATAKDVDDTTKAVDSSVSTLDDTKDFDSSSLTDTSLGL